jgi:hypothetical protein
MAGALALTAAQRDEVEAALRRRDLAPRVRERLELVKGAALGQEEAAIMAWSGRGARPEAIARQFPAVTLAELHRASAHSRQPQAELDASLRARLARQPPGGPHPARQLATIMLHER